MGINRRRMDSGIMGIWKLLNQALHLAFVFCLLQVQVHAVTFEEASENFEKGAYENAKIQFSCTKTQKIPLVIVPTLPQLTRRALKRLGKKDPQKVILIDDRNSNKAA